MKQIKIETHPELVLKILFGYALNYPDILTKTVNLIKEDMLDSVSEYPYKLVLRAFRQWSSDGNSESPDIPSFKVLVSNMAAQSPDFSEDERNDAILIVNNIETMLPKLVKPQMALNIIKDIVGNRSIKKEFEQGLRESVNGDDFIRLSQQFYDRTTSLATTTTMGAEDKEYFSMDMFEKKSDAFMPTHVAAMDELLYGGLTIGDAFGVLGTPGGGKTQFGVQLCCEQVLRKNYILYLMSENPPGQDLSTRFAAILANIPASVINTALETGSDIPDEYRDRLANAMDMMREYVIIDDHTVPGKCANGVDDIKNQIMALDRQGKHPTMVIIDQLQTMADRQAVSQVAKGDPVQQLRLNMTRIMNDSQNLATRAQTTIGILHQHNVEFRKMKPGYKPHDGTAAEMRRFQDFIRHLVAFGNRDEQGFSWLSLLKTRRGRFPKHIVVYNNTEEFSIDYLGSQFEPSMDGSCFERIDGGDFRV